MTTLPKFVIIDNKQELPMPYVLLTRDSYLIGKVKIVKQEEASAFLDNIVNERVTAAKVPGYSVFIIANGSMVGRGIDKTDALPILREMAQFFLTERIEPHKHPYKRYEDK